MTTRWIKLGIVAVVLVGCDVVFPYDSASSINGRADVGQRDVADDGRAPTDVQVSEDTVGRADGDENGKDLSRDVLNGDAPVDLQADALIVTDSGVDAGSFGPCIAGTQPFALSWTTNMALCEMGTGGIKQCAAPFVCATGWHLCSASEYLANGGRDNAPGGVGRYWLDSCIRKNDVVSPPSDSICDGGCTGLSGDSLPVAWTSSGAETWTGALYVGVASFGSLWRIGVDEAAYEAYWTNHAESGEISGVVCCQ